MNYLAHALLAGSDPEHRLGGLLGDFVKGSLAGCEAQYGARVVAGIAQHRRIDSYADAHAAFRRSRSRISAQRRRYGGVMVDMFYDHFLAARWSRFCDQPLEAFAADTYALLERHRALLPARLSDALPHMRADDWLTSYREVTAIATALDRMSAYRLRRDNALAGGVEELLGRYAEFEADFLEFLPDALEFAATGVVHEADSKQS